MEILTQQVGDALEVKVTGRLDNYWTDHLRQNVEEIIRGGAHVLRMNLSEMTFLSSAGVGLLVIFHRKLKGIGGSFVITSPSKHVKMVLDLCHLSPILVSDVGSIAQPPLQKKEPRRFSSSAGSFEVFACDPVKPMTFARIGDPAALTGCTFGPEHSRTIKFPHATFGIGLGAFGDSFDDAKTRFGEFLAIDGSAAYLPTDGTNVPDFMVASGDLVPEMNVLYGLRLEGGFTQQMRFETSAAEAPISLAQLADTALAVSEAKLIAMVIVAETAGLVGAALRRSPVAQESDGTRRANGVPFTYPEVRSWLSFSAESLYPRSLALIAGVAAGTNCPLLDPLLRPLDTAAWPVGHFHAAAFTYRPLPKGIIDLKSTITTLFETETLQSVMHLLSDNRRIAGRQQSEFVRGACWVSPMAEIQ